MNLYKYQGELISNTDFVKKLSEYIDIGDTINLQIDTTRFGKLCKGFGKLEFLEAMFNIFYQLVGDKGNIIIPSFSYSWGMDSPKKFYDVNYTPSKVGIFPEYFRKRNDVTRTLDPMFSYCIFGKDKENLLKNNSKTSFGKGSLFEKIHNMPAKLISFGLKRYDPTFVHYCEQYFHENVEELNYRFIKKFEGTIVDYDGREFLDHHYCFSRHLDKYVNWHFDERRLVKDLLKFQLINRVQIGNAFIWISDTQAVFDIIIKGLSNNKHYLINKNEGIKLCTDTI